MSIGDAMRSSGAAARGVVQLVSLEKLVILPKDEVEQGYALFASQ